MLKRGRLDEKIRVNNHFLRFCKSAYILILIIGRDTEINNGCGYYENMTLNLLYL